MENIERDKLYIVNSGKGGCFFSYDSVTGEEKLLETNEDVWRTIRESSTSFNVETQNYKDDMLTLEKSMGTMIYANDSYGLYGYLTSKKNRRTKQITLTINFFPVECFDKFKTKMLNTSGQWIEVPDDSLKPHGNINKKHIGFTDEEGKAVETKNVYSFLQRRLDRTKIEEAQQLTSLDKILSEIALPLPDINDFLSEEEQHQLEEKYAEKEGQLLNIEKQLLLQEQQQIEEEKEQIEKEKELIIKSDYLKKKQLHLECRSGSVKIREESLIPLINIAICTAKDRNTQLEIAKSYDTKENEFTREDYLYEYKLKSAMLYESLMIPMSYYKKIRAVVLKVLNQNIEATRYEIVGVMRFEDSKSKNLVAVINYDEELEDVRVVILKEYNGIKIDPNDIIKYEETYKTWLKEIMGKVRPHKIK